MFMNNEWVTEFRNLDFYFDHHFTFYITLKQFEMRTLHSPPPHNDVTSPLIPSPQNTKNMIDTPSSVLTYPSPKRIVTTGHNAPLKKMLIANLTLPNETYPNLT
jgi:hypothetical protein